MLNYTAIIITLATVMMYSCSSSESHQEQMTETKIIDSVVYESEHLVIRKLTENVFQHISYMYMDDIGKVDCNGMVVINNNEGIVFDTPFNDTSSTELIRWMRDSMNVKINAVVPTHFHRDCVGGLNSFAANGVPAYANKKTVEYAVKNGVQTEIKEFGDSTSFSVGGDQVIVQHLGAGHTRDNVVAYYPKDKALFGGCLIKSMGAGRGNLEDADTTVWTSTIEAIQNSFPSILLVIPGHGSVGGKELLEYTAKMFEADAGK